MSITSEPGAVGQLRKEAMPLCGEQSVTVSKQESRRIVFSLRFHTKTNRLIIQTLTTSLVKIVYAHL